MSAIVVLKRYHSHRVQMNANILHVNMHIRTLTGIIVKVCKHTIIYWKGIHHYKCLAFAALQSLVKGSHHNLNEKKVNKSKDSKFLVMKQKQTLGNGVNYKYQCIKSA